MSKTVTFFIGSSNAPNITNLIDNIGVMIGDEYELHLISTAPNYFNRGLDHYKVFGGDFPPTIMGSVRALKSYFQNNDTSAVVQLTVPPLHGLIVGSITKPRNIPAVYRYSGDRFFVYKVLKGGEKIKTYIINNMIGCFAARLANRHIVLGPTGKQRLINRGISPSSITILPPVVNTDRIQNNTSFNPELGIPEDCPVALFVGRLSYRKGLSTIENTLPEIVSEREDFHFVFLGEDQEFNALDRYSNHISLVGHVDPDKVPGYMSRADILIHPSLTEGLPRVILESLAAGTPVLARDVGEISTATANVFTSDEEFIRKLCNFESLPLDDISNFTLEKSSQQYLQFFKMNG